MKTRLVSAIKNGVVIDHIPAGQALKIMQLLHVIDHHQRVTLGLNLTSQTCKLKDLIKIENRELSVEDIDQIALFAPGATINHIKNFRVNTKVTCQLPEHIRHVLVCPNRNCMSHEANKSYFRLGGSFKEIEFYCFYCEKQFTRDQVEKTSL